MWPCSAGLILMTEIDLMLHAAAANNSTQACATIKPIKAGPDKSGPSRPFERQPYQHSMPYDASVALASRENTNHLAQGTACIATSQAGRSLNTTPVPLMGGAATQPAHAAALQPFEEAKRL